jgi:hypothetical protein
MIGAKMTVAKYCAELKIATAALKKANLKGYGR